MENNTFFINSNLLLKIIPNSKYINLYKNNKNYFHITINIKNIKNINKNQNKLGLLIKKDELIIVDISIPLYLKNLIKKLFTNITNDYNMSNILSKLFEILLLGSNTQLEKIENKIINIENNILNNHTKTDLNPTIFYIKKELILYKRYFDYLININYNIKKNSLINLLIDDTLFNIEKLINQVQMLLEETIHLREIYQSILDFNQNKTIKLLTLITTIFFPLSIITSWYGMNFKYMPEISFKYGYPVIIVISISFIIITLIIFKRKKIL